MADPAVQTGHSPGRPVIVAVVAPGHPSGRTGVVANLAWMIATAGRHVLVLDWDPRGSAVHDYLRSFLVEQAAVDDSLGDGFAAALGVLPAVGAGPASLTLRRYLPGGPSPLARLDVVEQRGPAQAPPSGDERMDTLAELHRRLRESSYDYVLVDGDPPSTEPGVSPGGWLADRLVLCFRAHHRWAEAAAAMAASLQRATPIRREIVAVPTYFGDSGPAAAADLAGEFRSVILRALRRGDSEVGPVRQVPLPAPPLDDVVVALAYDQDTRGSLVAAYRELLAAATGDDATELPALPASVRRRYIRHVTGGSRLGEPDPEPVTLLYRPADRPWADWVRRQLEAAGVSVQARHQGTVVTSAPGAAALIAGSGPTPVAALAGVEDLTVVTVAADAPVVPGAREVALHHDAPDQARRRLLATFGVAGPDADRARPGRLPTERPRVTNLAEPDRPAVDRWAHLETMRDTLNPDRAAWVVLRGRPGSGKTELARAYANRFGHDYAVVWFVPGQSRTAARTALSALAVAIGADPAGDPGTAALRTLREDGQPYLLVYDDVGDVEKLRGLYPADDTGHVIVIGPEAGPEPDRRGAALLDVGVLEPAEARAALARHLPELADADAEAVVAAVGTEPLTLRLAAGGLRAAVEILRDAGQLFGPALHTSVVGFVASLPPRADADRPAQRLSDVGRSVFDLLGGSAEGQAMAALARMCAYLSSDGIGLGLIRSNAMLDRLVAVAGPAGAGLAADASDIEVVVAGLARLELCSVDWAAGASFRMHRAVQAMIRDIGDPDTMERVQQQTLLALAAYAPGDAEYLAGHGRDRLRELGRHLRPSGALDEPTSDAVRRWVVMQLGSVAATGDVDERADAAELATRMRARWAGDPADRLGARLAVHLGDLLRSLGRDAAALEIDAEVLEAPRTPDFGRLRTVLSRRGYAGDLRGLGAFPEALTEDRSIVRSLQVMLGPDHQQSLRALHNLALSNYLAGLQQQACGLEAEVYHRRLRLFGRDDPLTWWSALDLGIYRRELGALVESRLLLKEAHERLTALRGELDPLTIRAAAARAVTERRLGSSGRARLLGSAASAAYEQALGRGSLSTQAARLSLAIDLIGEEDALSLAQECLGAFRRNLPEDHPFIAVCLVNLALVQRRTGRTAEAVESATTAIAALDARLGEVHPWAVGARINLANALADAGDDDRAQARYAEARSIALEVLPVDHPYRFLLRDPVGDNPRPGTDVDIEVPAT